MRGVAGILRVDVLNVGNGHTYSFLIFPTAFFSGKRLFNR